MGNRLKGSKATYIGWAISLIFLAIALRNIDLGKLRDSLTEANLAWLGLAIIIYLSSFLIRGARWSYMLQHVKGIGLRSLTSVVIIGFMANNVLPVRMGEFVRAYVVGRKEKVDAVASFATIVMERVFDGLTLVLFLVLTVRLLDIPGWVSNIGYPIAGIFLFALVVICVLAFNQRLATRFISIIRVPGLPRITESIRQLANSFIFGLNMIRQPKLVMVVALLSIAVWLCEGLMYYVTFLAFNIDLDLLPALMVLVFANIAIMIPSAPGQIGTFELFCQTGLLLFAVESNVALSYALVLHACQFLPITLIGFILLWKWSLTLGQLREARSVVQS